ncbi:hypothetical protein ACFFWE_11370 [Sphaerisporangium melleum]|uniref:hypothetical protein n=1 Tax=Sphaerisporangium melleum TaxID=321316 RepID=UPI00166D7FA1|nr:hypothetical protein [Sphaerisporangium melleum]
MPAGHAHALRAGAFIASVRAAWGDVPGYRRLAYLTGALLVVAGLVQAAIWAVTGGSASGPLSWRKPVTFGLSFGMTTATLAAVAAHLPVRRWLGLPLSVLLCGSTTLEVAWVTLQHARGVPSHFNGTTPFDETLWLTAAVSIGVTNLVLLTMTVAAFARTQAPAPMRWAIRAGLVALLVAQLVGAWMIVHGNALVDAGADPFTRSMSTYGVAGAMKAAHAVPMHAIQVFVVLAWLLARTGLPRRRQVALVLTGVAGYAGLFVIVLLRTAAGLAPFDLDAGALLYLLPAGLLAAAALPALTRAARPATGRVGRVM